MRPAAEKRPWLNIHEAAAYLGVTVSGLYHHIADNRIPYGRLGRHYRFHPDELDAFIRSRGNTAEDLRLVARR